MKKLYNLILLLLLLAISWGCTEEQFVEPLQYGSISGQVLNKKDGKPINKAAVRLNPSGRTLQTDTTGRFRFDTIPAGKYTLQATKEAFRDELTTVDVSGSYGAATVMYMVNENPPPTEPLLVAPTTSVSGIATVLKWKSTDSNKDPLTYDIVITREGSTAPTQLVSGISADSLVLKGLAYGTTYYWQIIVSDGVNTVTGKMWSFRTGAFPDISYVFARRVEGRYQIFAAADGTTAIQLTQPGNNWRPIVSPNRKQIAFISNAETDLHLFVMNYDGSNLHRATTVPVGGLMPADLSFCWSPDGMQLLYPSNNKLYVVQADGSGNGSRSICQAPIGRAFSGCDWTPQGDRIIARTTGSSIYDNRFVLMSSQGKDTMTVLSKTNCRVGNPVFSVAGDKAIFSCDAANFQNEQGRQLNAQLSYISTAATAPRGLRDPLPVMASGTGSTKAAGTNDLEPRLSPNGSKIIFTNVSNTGIGEYTVMSVDFTGQSSSGQNRTVLIRGAEMPYWR